MQHDITPRDVAAQVQKKYGGAISTANQMVLKAIREKRLNARNVSAPNRPIYLVSAMDADEYISNYKRKN